MCIESAETSWPAKMKLLYFWLFANKPTKTQLGAYLVPAIFWASIPNRKCYSN